MTSHPAPTSSDHVRRRSAEAVALALLAAVVAFTVQTFWVRQFAVSVPFWDEWDDLFGFLARYETGRIGWRDFFVQHMEHRIPVARLAFIFVYEVFGEGSLLGCLTVSAALMGAIAAVWVYTIRRLDEPLWLIAATLVPLLSVSQHENMLWGFQVEFYTLVLPVVAAVAFIALKPRISWPAVLGLAGACAVSSYSIASGLTSWGVVGSMLFLRTLAENRSLRALVRARRAWLQMAAFVALGTLVAVAYLYDYQRLHPPRGTTKSLWTMLRWSGSAFVYPIVDPTVRWQAMWLPLVVLALAAPIALALRLYWRRHEHARLLLMSGVLLMVLSNIAVMSLGRSAVVFVASRYGTICLWTSALALLAIADLLRAARARPERRWAIPVLALVATFIVGAQAWRYSSYLEAMRTHRRNRLTFGRNVLQYMTNADPDRQLAAFVPFPRETGKALLADPQVVRVLPSNLRPVAAVTTTGDAWTVDGVYPTTGDRSGQFAWGSWSGDDARTGTLTSTPFGASEPLVLTVSGYPSRPGNSLAIEAATDPARRIVYSGPDPGERWTEWRLDRSQLPARRVRVVAVDSSRGSGGWLGVGISFRTPAAVRRLEAFVNGSELWMAPFVVALAAWIVWERRHRELSSLIATKATGEGENGRVHATEKH